MKKNRIIFLLITLIGISLTEVLAQQTDVERSSLKYRQKNLGAESKKTISKTRRGGQPTYPKGIEGKKINFGFTLGGAIALMDALNEEHCPFGGNFNFFIHGIFKKSKTFALGAEIKTFYLLTNKEKYQQNIISSFKTDLKKPDFIVNGWFLGAVQVSALGNFNPLPRCNLQIKVNLGPMMGLVPKNSGEYQAKRIDGVDVIRNFNYDNKLIFGLSASLGMDVLYAITDHTEFKVGLDWTYLRFEFERVEFETITTTQAITAPKTITESRQFGVFDIHIGFAFSF